MAQLYPNALLPPAPHSYAWPKTRAHPANKPARAILHDRYESFIVGIQGGGLEAYNAITVQELTLLRDLIISPQPDVLETQRAINLLRTWFEDANDHTLDITPDNCWRGPLALQEIRDADNNPRRQLPPNDPNHIGPGKLGERMGTGKEGMWMGLGEIRWY